MLRLIENGRSDRLWYQGELIDLVVWPADSGPPQKFELSQRFPHGNELLRWQCTSGFSWHLIDSGEERPARHKASALLQPVRPDGLGHWLQRLQNEDSGLPGPLRDNLHTLLSG